MSPISSRYESLFFGTARLGEATISRQTLHPEESAHAKTLSDRRCLQFTMGRIAAHKAIQLSGVTITDPILSDKDGNPTWPDAITGSVSHTKSLAIAVVGKTTNWRSLGVDIEEKDRDITKGLAKRISHPEELAWIESSSAGASQATLALFSLKESTFKAVFPLCHKHFGFKDASIHPDADKTDFTIIIERDLSKEITKGFSLKGSLLYFDRYLVSVVVLPAGISASA